MIYIITRAIYEFNLYAKLVTALRIGEGTMSERITELGLVISVPASFQGAPADHAEEATQSIRIHMNALGGEVYSVTFSVEAAKGMLTALATWPPLCAFVQELNKKVPPQES